MQDAEREEGRKDIGRDVRGPEPRESVGKFLALEEIGEVQDNVGNESTLNESQERSCGVKTSATGDATLRRCDDTPCDHLNWDPFLLVSSNVEGGYQLSGPIFLEMSWEGISARRKER